MEEGDDDEGMAVPQGTRGNVRDILQIKIKQGYFTNYSWGYLH